MEIIEGYDIIVDGVDNFPTRYLLNDATVRLQIPVVSAAILGFDGQLSVFAPYEGPCYRCLFPQPPPAELAPSCGANGVLGVLPGTMGLLQATEVVKLIVGAGEPLIGRLLMYDALGATFTELKVRRDPECPICSREPDEIADEEMGVFPDYEAFCAAAGLGPRRPTWRRSRSHPSCARPTGGEREVSADGETRRRRPRRARRRAPRDARQLFGDDGDLNRYVNVYLNDEDVRVLDGLETPVGESDTLVILPAMAGGCAAQASPRRRGDAIARDAPQPRCARAVDTASRRPWPHRSARMCDRPPPRSTAARPRADGAKASASSARRLAGRARATRSRVMPLRVLELLPGAPSSRPTLPAARLTARACGRRRQRVRRLPQRLADVRRPRGPGDRRAVAEQRCARLGFAAPDRGLGHRRPRAAPPLRAVAVAVRRTQGDRVDDGRRAPRRAPRPAASPIVEDRDAPTTGATIDAVDGLA